MGFLVTNEHGSNRVPASAAVFLDAAEREGRFSLDAGFDIGAGEVARSFASELACPLVEAPFHPAVIDCNRPLGHRLLFSKPMRSAPAEVREQLVRDIHIRHQKRIAGLLEEQIRLDGQVIHLAIHSFAPFEPGPVPEGETRFDAARRTDLGLLYDPKRQLERALCDAWSWNLYESLPMLRVRRNYPIRGTRDGLTKRLRQSYPEGQYLGIELQLNQAWCARSVPISRQTILGIIAGLVALCDHHRSFAA